MKTRTLVSVLAFAATACPRPAAAVSDEAAFAEWHRAMAGKHAPKEGCYVATYPGNAWSETECGPPVTQHYVIGGGSGFGAQSAGGIGSATGRFYPVVITGETDSTGRKDSYSLQLNTNRFPAISRNVVMADGSRPCSTAAGKCQGSQQFAFNGSGIFIEYWLNDFLSTHASCPANPGGPVGSKMFTGPWGQSGPTTKDCVINSYNNPVFPNVPAAALGTVEFTASVTGLMDEIRLAAGPMIRLVVVWNLLGLDQGWTNVEFNVFGNPPGDQANFDPGTTLTVVDSLGGLNGGRIGASCAPVSAGGNWTGETNNLNIAPCQCFSSGAEVSFTESNAAVPACACPTGAVWNAGTGSCDCAAPEQIKDPKTGQCSCPGVGQVVSNGHCGCRPGEERSGDYCFCPPGTGYSSSQGRCVPNFTKCPAFCSYGCYPPVFSPPDPPTWICKPPPD